MKYYKKSKAKRLEEGQFAICKCNGWSFEDYIVAQWDDGRFKYDGGEFDEYVTHFLPLDKDGLPVKLKKKEKKPLTAIEMRAIIKTVNLGYLSRDEFDDLYLLGKLYDWQEGYEFTPWTKFKENYNKCCLCDNYSDDQCICYAR